MIPNHEQVDEYGYEVWDENHIPLAYLITIRTFGTWLHGDERTSVKRDGWNRPGHPRYPINATLDRWMSEEMSQELFVFNTEMLCIVDEAIRDACNRRGFELHARHVRTNHAHSVITAPIKPERIADALKANAARRLREAGLIGAETKVWSRGRSRRYLWKPRHVAAAVDYTNFGQGEFLLPE